MIDCSIPFVLLDDARPDGGARLYTAPSAIITATRASDVPAALDRLRAASGQGAHLAGHLAYEAGHALVGPTTPPPADAPLLWFGLFDAPRHITPAETAALLPDPAGAWAGPPRPRLDATAHAAAVDRVQALIAAGDIYQANLTFPADVAVAGDPLALYARLRRAQLSPWGGVVWTGDHWLLSLSPELFFTVEAGCVTARPMKGTATRGSNPLADAEAAATLAADPKQRAENLMIVDLLRNDLSRIAEPASVAVPHLFVVETYPTIHQMTSTVTARLGADHDAIDLLAAAFPCGSITGAPKRRAMEVIDAVEMGPRGAYTGSIGRIDPSGDAAFNVAIRTLVMEGESMTATLGLGSGIVADSVAPEEWRESLAKAGFVTAGQQPFDLIETMRFDPYDGLLELDRHMGRLKASAAAFDFTFDHHGARNELQAATFKLRDARCVRLRLSPRGSIAIEVSAIPRSPASVSVALAPLPVDPADFRLRHKTSDRAFYDIARKATDGFEVAFTDPAGFLTEGSFTNLFVQRGETLLTPPLSRGLLPGVLRASLIGAGRAEEADLTPADLKQGFFIGNQLRGLIPARLVAGSERLGL
ncbi:aminodeoxychorismate synthase component I [Sphingomonas naphthae]|uniref:Probable branched-chain-amino-acid aminotransferase n=1 Tax=Sphingomonas naphthae TaxID=1813468 RepID=A0ABY7TKB3_9SPHN|nr:aminodeoxychorismate synthase component I [Sphingomonas naphthae]WCT73152.1 aminodeoxychorismate synthase component I [Sphingomonas naphthae]